MDCDKTILSVDSDNNEGFLNPAWPSLCSAGGVAPSGKGCHRLVLSSKKSYRFLFSSPSESDAEERFWF